MMAHTRLADGKDLCQFQHAKRIVGQRAQHIQTQRITASLAESGELVVVGSEGLEFWQVHRLRSLDAHILRSNDQYQNFLILVTLAHSATRLPPYLWFISKRHLLFTQGSSFAVTCASI